MSATDWPRLTIKPASLPEGGLTFMVEEGCRNPLVVVSDLMIEDARVLYPLAVGIVADFNRYGIFLNPELYQTVLIALRTRRQWLEGERGAPEPG